MKVSMIQVQKVFMKYPDLFLGIKMYYKYHSGYIVKIRHLRKDSMDVDIQRKEKGSVPLWTSDPNYQFFDSRDLIKAILKR